MALLEATLASELETALTPGGSNDIGQAFGNYFKDATFNGGPVNVTNVDGIAVPAAQAALVFPLQTAAAGAATFVAGFTAFWGTIVAAPASFFVASSVTAPPGLATLAAALLGVFATNQQPSITLSQAAANLAAAIHPNAGLGGIGIIGGNPFPIL